MLAPFAARAPTSSAASGESSADADSRTRSSAASTRSAATSIDFVAPSLGLVIEIDGGQHAERVEEDRERTEFLERQGFRVLRFWNSDLIESSDAVLGESSAKCDSATGLPLTPTLSPTGRGGDLLPLPVGERSTARAIG
jgi:hypothetical protein